MREHAIESAIKLASNENPYDPLPSVRAALADAGGGINRYPDHRATAVREALADRLGVTPAHVAVGCGSVGLLQQLLLAYADEGDEVLYAWRSFEAYPIYTAIAGATEVTTPLRFHGLDLPTVTKAVTDRTRVVLVTSPNNPTGTAVGHDELVELLEASPHALVVLDEAYYEYVTGLHAPRAAELLRHYANLAVLRTFSKAYGLAGLRIGYLTAHPNVVAAVDQALIPFAVNGMAQAGALASLEHDDELAARVATTRAERARLQRALRQLGFSTPDAQANFLWLPAGAAAAALTLKLETLGVVTRPFPDEGIRVTIGLPEENDRFLDAFDAAAEPLELAAHWGLPTGRLAVQVQDWVDRIDVADARLVEHRSRPHHGLTQPDPGGTERWEVAEVWGHLGEIGGYWLVELQGVIDAGSDEPVPFGRVKSDLGRLAAIAAGRQQDAGALMLEARRNLAALRAYVAGLSTEDWRRVGRHATLGDMDVPRQLEEFHVGHVEQHLAQLDDLARPL
jgi:histidinol-phosphate aminotransferase